MKVKYTILKPFGLEICIDQYDSPYCKDNTFYMMPADVNSSLYMDTIEKIKQDRDSYKDRYDNVLKGLKYWKEKALEKR